MHRKFPYQKVCCSRQSLIVLFAWLSILSCSQDRRGVKENFARRIAKENCQEISQLSKSVVGGILSGLSSYLSEGRIQNIETGSLGQLPENWCDCYTYFVALDLSDKFTEKELMEINRDNVKKVMVLTKIVELRQDDMKRCIEETTNEIAKDYGRFAKELEEKFKK